MPPSSRMMTYLQSLPEAAFAMIGDIGAEDRFLFNSPVGRVLYRSGWGDLRERVTVSFWIPASGSHGPEVFSICVKMSSWGRIPAPAWRSMILTHAPYGIFEFPVQ
ncbi:hypothetical protein FRC03_002826 [Tulasnella sp. 419]|nr:hypothetical protein FRC03_002826 [Tulasnella sp. 419]